jgi:peptidoglycan DL-endopeptidase LytF
MSRRDTIIVAILINTGLLGVLFMMAIHTESDEPETSFQTMHQIAEVDIKMPEHAESSGGICRVTEPCDEIDQVLKNYSMKTAAPIGVTTPHQENPDSITLPPSRNLLKEENQRFVEVTVKRGDYLEKIAKANGTTVTAIKRANQLSTSRIDIGQVLLIPIEDQPKSASQAAPKKQVVEEPQYYTMKSGDNPWKVAKLHKVGFGELLKLNNLDEDKARNLKPGDVLRVK